MHDDALMLNAGALGLSYGDYVARLVAGSRLPQPLAQRQADRGALLASNDRIAALSTDLVALVTLLRQAKVEQARPYRDRLETADAEIRRHLDRASALIDRLSRRTDMPSTVDGLLVQWGDRLFYPSNRMTASRTPVLTEAAIRQRAQALRQRVRATVARRAPQVMIKVTGGGRGMGAIAAHLRYIAKAGRLPI